MKSHDGNNLPRQFFHGSICSGITIMEPRSLLHGTQRSALYLTDSVPYALLYIWDAQHNHTSQKYVTGGIRDGVAFYEEQFPDQLRTFYQGVSGWLYTVDGSEAVHPLPDRPRLFYAEEALAVTDAHCIPDVYEALLASEAAGDLRILRFREQTPARQQELTAMIAAYIRQMRFFSDDPGQRAFMQRYFPAAWVQAEATQSKPSV